MKRTTLCYPIMNGKVLLAMKKRGFGTGKWNGPGGKRCEGESAEDASRRETREEVNISVGAIEHRGVIFFSLSGSSGLGQCVRYLRDIRYTGSSRRERRNASGMVCARRAPARGHVAG